MMKGDYIQQSPKEIGIAIDVVIDYFKTTSGVIKFSESFIEEENSLEGTEIKNGKVVFKTII